MCQLLSQISTAAPPQMKVSNAGCGIDLIPKKGTKSDVWLEQKDGTVMN